MVYILCMIVMEVYKEDLTIFSCNTQYSSQINRTTTISMDLNRSSFALQTLIKKNYKYSNLHQKLCNQPL